MTKTTSTTLPVTDALGTDLLGATAMGQDCGASWWGFVHHHVE
jgi:hypothetical protein